MKSYEMVETLSSKANVSLEQAKIALENSNWDILDAAIYLERHRSEMPGSGPACYMSNAPAPKPNPKPQFSNNPGKPYGGFIPPAPPPPYSGFQGEHHVPPYKNFPNPGANVPPPPPPPPFKQAPNYGTQYPNPNYQESLKSLEHSVNGFVDKLARAIEKIVNAIFGTKFIVIRNGNVIFNMPFMIYLIAMFAFWLVIIPIMVLGLAFDCKYSVGNLPETPFKQPNYPVPPAPPAPPVPPVPPINNYQRPNEPAIPVDLKKCPSVNLNKSVGTEENEKNEKTAENQTDEKKAESSDNNEDKPE